MPTTHNLISGHVSEKLLVVPLQVHYDTTPPDPHFCTHLDCFTEIKQGTTAFLRELQQCTGRGVNWWTGGLTWFANTVDVAAIQPYIENLELAAYWNDDPFNASLSRLEISRRDRLPDAQPSHDEP